MNAPNQDNGFVTECKVSVTEKGYEITVVFNARFHGLTPTSLVPASIDNFVKEFMSNRDVFDIKFDPFDTNFHVFITKFDLKTIGASVETIKFDPEHIGARHERIKKGPFRLDVKDQRTI